MNSPTTSEIDRRNNERAERGRAVVAFYLQNPDTGNDDLRDDIMDVLVDLGHLAAQQGYDVRQLFQIAHMHVRAEQAGEESF